MGPGFVYPTDAQGTGTLLVPAAPLWEACSGFVHMDAAQPHSWPHVHLPMSKAWVSFLLFLPVPNTHSSHAQRAYPILAGDKKRMLFFLVYIRYLSPTTPSHITVLYLSFFGILCFLLLPPWILRICFSFVSFHMTCVWTTGNLGPGGLVLLALDAWVYNQLGKEKTWEEPVGRVLCKAWLVTVAQSSQVTLWTLDLRMDLAR